MSKILFIFGTRPEAIKLVSLIKLCKENKLFRVKVCSTTQHKSMLYPITNFFRIHVDYDLMIMRPNQTLFHITKNVLAKVEKILRDFKPDLIFVQGDTTSAFVGSLAAYYNRIKVAHIESGLRSFNKYAPFPEEMNRILIDHIVDYHFAPSQKAKQNLENEGLTKDVWVVGNTVIDTLLLGLKLINEHGDNNYIKYFKFINFKKKLILVTIHRRESFGKGFHEICQALKEIATKFPDTEIVYPVHLNPNINVPAHKLLGDIDNIYLIKPLPYQYFVWLMEKSKLILTDSGGIQEEAPSLRKPVLVLRQVTERTEGIDAGTAKLVGTNKDAIFKETSKLLSNKEEYKKMSQVKNPYGDGTAAQKILNIIGNLDL